MINAPFFHTEKTYKTIMADILIVLFPVLLWSVFIFGARVLTIVSLTVVSCIFLEFLSRCFLSKFNFKLALQQSTDLSSVVTGILISFMLPVTIPLYLTVLAAFFAVVIAKQLFGGVGKNILNPAVFSVALLKLLLPSLTSSYTKPYAYFNAFTLNLNSDLVGTVRVFSPLQMLGKGQVYEDGVSDLFYGTSAGNIGEIAVILLFLGAAYLAYRKIINIKSSLSFVGTVFLIAFFFPQGNSETIYFALTEVMSGGVILLSVFACNDFTTSPKREIGKILFGVGCGVFTILIRYIYPNFDGAYIAVLIMNLLTPVIDKFTRTVPYGMLKPKKS